MKVSVAFLLERLIPIISNAWLEVSAKLCIASENIDHDPEARNHRNLIMAMMVFPVTAAMTANCPLL